MSNSRVESHNRAELRNRIISAATLLEDRKSTRLNSSH